jgi:uncharacterized membrane protein
MAIMVTEEERKFVAYWSKNRDREKKIFRQLLIGLPIGLLFAIPIIINFSSGWYKRADMWARAHTDDSTGTVLVIAALIIVVFVAIFSRKYRWERYEQQYLEIQFKIDKEKLASGKDT